MISQSQQPLTQSIAGVSTGKRLAQVLLWPFTHRFSSPIWLALRLYVGWIWFQMGTGKLEAGWLTSDPIAGLLKHVANGTLPVPFEFYRGVAGFLISSGATTVLSHTMPFLELAVALAFFSGVLVRPAAIGGLLLLGNLALSGIGTMAFDGQIALYHGLLVLAGSVAGLIGFERLAARILALLIGAVRSALPAPQGKLALVPVRIVRRRR